MGSIPVRVTKRNKSELFRNLKRFGFVFTIKFSIRHCFGARSRDLALFLAKKKQVGSDFRPILSRRERRDGARRAPPFGGGRPRAMLAPDASVGKAENITLIDNFSLKMRY